MHSKPIKFTKMHGLGNDFIVLNTLDQAIDKKPAVIAQLANRYTGVGCDQVLLIEPSTRADFFCRILNADGSEAEQCGNGLRCVARFIHEEGLCKQPAFILETLAGLHAVSIPDYDHIRIAMGTPQIIAPAAELTLANQEKRTAAILSMGNPHAILKVAAIETAPVASVGAELTKHAYFPQGANIGFMQIIDSQHIRLRTYERGAGETYACGSNACAAVAAGILHGWLKQKVTVEFQQGSLVIEWEGIDQPLYMSGPAARVFEGKI